MRATTAVLLLAAALPACTGLPRDPHSAEGPLPYIAVREPAQPGTQEVLLLARFAGKLRIDDRCVRWEGSDGQMATPVFYDGTTIGRDERGVYVRDPASGLTIRDGDRVVGGGGEIPATMMGAIHPATGPLPRACLGKFLSVNPGLKRA